MKNYRIRARAIRKIETFYTNVFNKYPTYTRELMCKNIDDAYFSMFKIENGLLRRKPTISRWQRPGWWMANTKRWYYAYIIEGDTIHVMDSCHAQNMHEATQRGENLFPLSTRKHIAHIITENVMGKIRQLI